MGWKEEAERWKKAYWASLNRDSQDERLAILEKQKKKRKKPTKKKTTKIAKPVKTKKKATKKKPKSILKQLDLF